MEIIKPWKDCQIESQYAKLETKDYGDESQIFICKRMLEEENLKIGVCPTTCHNCNDQNYQKRKITSMGNIIKGMMGEEQYIIDQGKKLIDITGEEYVKELLLEAAGSGEYTIELLLRIAKGLDIE